MLTREKGKLTAEMEKLYDLYQSGSIDKQGFGAKYHPLADRSRQLDDEIPRTQAELDVLKITHLSQEEIVSEARDLFTRWPTLAHDERRRVVEAITERITIGKDNIEIDLFYAPPMTPSKSAPASARVPSRP